MTNATPYVALTEARRYSAWTWPDGVTLDTFYAADSLQHGVAKKAQENGVSSYFGETTALAALHQLAIWICRLPRPEREAVLLWIGGER